MRILQLHLDFIEYEPIQKEIEIAENTEKKLFRFENLIALFVSVEEEDDESLVEKVVEDTKQFLNNLKLNRVLIYPYAHLSKELATPSKALNLLKLMEEKFREVGIEVFRAPFGWNKALSLKVKGYPLAEQLRIYEGKEEVSTALKMEEQLISEWYILDEKGNLIEVDRFDFSNFPNLEKLARYEIAKSRKVDRIPPHVTLMKRLEIADSEPGSDPGNLRYYPKGRLIKSLLESFVTQKVLEFGAMEVETPLMYDYNHPAFADYLNRFPARHYVLLSDNKKFFMRFSACFGQFLIAKDAQLSYKNLPLRIYELTRYSFRREKSGEITGLRRLRSFTMPDMHTFCKDLKEAKKEFKKQFDFCLKVLLEIGFTKDDFEVALRFTKDFWKQNKNFIISLIKKFGKPFLIEMWNYRYAYFDPKFEFNFVDALDKASALSTVQIDHENSKRYGIKYVDENGKEQYPLILHCSPSGAIERVMYALLEKAYLEEKKGGVPSLPFWLSPTQIRLIPVNDSFLPFCEKVSKKLEKFARVDIDDRNETVQRKIRDAEMEWVPLILVVGEKEVKTNKFQVRIREEKTIKEMDLKEILKWVKTRIGNKPFKPLNLPKRISKRVSQF